MERNEVRLTNHIDGDVVFDKLYLKAENTSCNVGRYCSGSIVFKSDDERREHGELRPIKELKHDAMKFFEEFFRKSNNKKQKKISVDFPFQRRGSSIGETFNIWLDHLHNGEQVERVKEVFEEIDATGTYNLTEQELAFGAKLAWRNAARCIGRKQWLNLKILDFRHVTSAKQIYDGCIEHIKYATNDGIIRSTISVFAKRTETNKETRIWNNQLIRFAGYLQSDGTIIGDPASMEFTEVCKNLGWQGNGGEFDVLPLVVQYKGEKPELFEIPEEIILRVNLNHPNFPEFDKLHLQWYAVPIISNMCLDIGGLEFTCAPFNGWYMGTEISKNFMDLQRYKKLQPIAKSFGYDTSNVLNLWKDKAGIELTYAVLHSFTKAHVTIVDHHSASDQFSEHLKYENIRRGGCPADWVWIVPPISGTLTSVYHQEMLNYHLKPSFNYMVKAWKYHQKQRRSNLTSFKLISRVILVFTKLMMSYLVKRPRLTVLYGTETGHSKKFAKHVQQVFSETFYTSFSSLDEYRFTDVGCEITTFIIVVTSTFGNGEAPSNAEQFHSQLKQMICEDELTCTQEDTWLNINFNEGKRLANYKYAVFALGSSAYPDFCAFGHDVNSKLRSLGAEEICQIGEGDELSGQEDSFLEWLDECYENACNEFPIDPDSKNNSVLKLFGENVIDTKGEWKELKFRIIRAPHSKKKSKDICAKLASTNKIPVFSGKVISVENLQTHLSRRKTNLVRLDISSVKDLQKYEIGDSLAVFPENPTKEVNRLLKRCRTSFDPYEPITLEIDVNFENDDKDVGWTKFDRFDSPTTLRMVFERYLDISTPPTQTFLKNLIEKATHPADVDMLTKLGTYEEAYDEWKSSNVPTIADTLEEFSSVIVSATFLLTQLPLLKPRSYSISSSPRVYPNEIHLTVSLLSYETQGEQYRRKGVCSSWLDGLKEDDIVPCYLKKSSRLRLPDSSEPIIMVGPGTGIAPFRAFWQELTYKSNHLNNGMQKQFREVSLYTGCRNPHEDFLFQEEIRKVHKAGIITNVQCAFSRVKRRQKMYVQHLMKQDAREIYRILCKENGHVFVCGGIEMAKDVKEALYEIIAECSKLSTEEAVEMMDMLKVNGRYHEEVFGIHYGFSDRRKQFGRRQSMHPSRIPPTLPWLVDTEKLASSL